MILQIPHTRSTSEPWGAIELGPYQVINNTWGDTAGALEQSISARKKSRDIVMRWDVRDGSEDKVHGFPHILLGKHPWGETSTEALPVRLSSVDEIPASVTWRMAGKGKFNAAFDVWLTRAPPHSEMEIAAEVMIWLGARGGMLPYGALTTPDVMPGFDLWHGISYFGGPPAQVLTFFPNAKVAPALRIDLRKMLRIACKAANLNQLNLWLSAIELGAECVSGKGSMVISKLEIEI